MKKVSKIIMVFLLLGCMCGCGTKYEDTNGSDTTLQTITDENIINLDLGSSGLKYSESEIAGITIDAKYSSKNFNGVQRIYDTRFILESDVNIMINSLSIHEGNFKLAFINDGKIIKEVSSDMFGEMIYFEDLIGVFSIHIAGESASFELYIEDLD